MRFAAKAFLHERSIISILWIISTIFYIQYFGINTALEAEKYITQAKLLLGTGRISEARYWFYLPTILVISVSLFFKAGFAGAVFIQAIVNFFAYHLFFKALKKIFPTQKTAFFIIIYLLVFWPYQSWIAFLYTESLFYSSILILISCIILYKPNSFKNILLLFFALTFTILSRPLGILFAGSVLAYILFSISILSKKMLFFFTLVTMIVAGLIINIIFSTISDWDILKPFVEGNIICNYPSQHTNSGLKISREGSPLYQLFYYIIKNPKHFLGYVFIKLRYFYLMYRNYYSGIHNIFLLGNIIPVYLLSIIGVAKNTRIGKPVLAFILCTILFFTAAIILQCDDWHNRFILSIFPIILVLAATGLLELKKVINKFLNEDVKALLK